LLFLLVPSWEKVADPGLGSSRSDEVLPRSTVQFSPICLEEIMVGEVGEQRPGAFVQQELDRRASTKLIHLPAYWLRSVVYSPLFRLVFFRRHCLVIESAALTSFYRRMPRGIERPLAFSGHSL